MLKEGEKKAGNAVKLKKHGIFEPSVIEHRRRVAAAEPTIKPANVPFVDLLVPIPGDVRIPVRIYTPLSAEARPYPTLFYVPGTAFVAHESRFTKVTCSHICERAKCQVIVINHRLSPEHTSCDSFQDVYQVMRFFLTHHAYKLMIDQSRIGVGGYSSGGNLAALMAIQSQKDGIPILVQLLLSPIVDLSRSLKTFRQFEERDTDISEEFVSWFLDLAVPESRDPADPAISPFWSTDDNLAKLPLTAIIWAEMDRFRSDAEEYYQKLTNLGVHARKMIVEKQTHAYLWQQLEIVERVSDDILGPVFKAERVERPLSHKLFFVTPPLMHIEERSNNQKKDTALAHNITSTSTLTIRSRL